MRDILITGGKGTTGRRVASELMRLGLPYRVATRNPTEQGEVPFDWRLPDASRSAFSTAGAVYVVAPTDTSDQASIVLPVLEKAVQEGVTRLVLLSASSLELAGPIMGQIHSWLADNASDWAVLRPSWFMQNLHNQHRQSIIEERAIYTATGEGRVGFIDAGDIARVAVSALTARHAWNRDYILTGPKAISYADVAVILSRETGTTVRHRPLDSEAYAARLAGQGMDKIYAQALADMDDRIAGGAENRVTSHVHELTGHVPVSITDFLQKNIEKWQSR